MALSIRAAWNISYATICNALVVSSNLVLLLQALLNQSKCVHWIPPVGCFNSRSFGAVFVSEEMNDAFRCPYLQLIRVERMDIITYPLYLVLPNLIQVELAAWVTPDLELPSQRVHQRLQAVLEIPV